MPLFNNFRGNGGMILPGSGVPGPALGAIGDYFIDDSAKKLYGPKSSSGWGSGASLVGPAGTAAVGAPISRTVALATAYQATDPAKPAMVTVEVEVSTTITLAGPGANTIELVIGQAPTIATTGGTRADVFRSDVSVSILISVGLLNRATLRTMLPAGWYFAVRRPSGSASTIVGAFEQALG